MSKEKGSQYPIIPMLRKNKSNINPLPALVWELKMKRVHLNSYSKWVLTGALFGLVQA